MLLAWLRSELGSTFTELHLLSQYLSQRMIPSDSSRHLFACLEGYSKSPFDVELYQYQIAPYFILFHCPFTFIICQLLFIIGHLLFAIGHLLFIIGQLLFIIGHLLFIIGGLL